MNFINRILVTFLLILSLLKMVLVNSQIGLSVATIVVVIALFWRTRESRKCLIFTALLVASEVGHLLVPNVFLWIFHLVLLWSYLIWQIVIDIKRFRSTLLKVLVGIVSAFGMILLAGLMYLTLKPDPILKIVQERVKTVNSFEPATYFKVTPSEGKVLKSDIQYGKTYPNSFLDIMTSQEENTADRPTYIYFHGGGWTSGDKMQGDPNQVSEYSASLYHFEQMVENGYNVVTINYALAPDYRYPTPLIQLSEAVTFLQQHADQYGINMKSVIISGSSAGGNLAADFLNIQVNDEFAKAIGIAGVLEKDHLLAGVLEVPALDLTRVSKTSASNVMNDYFFGQSLAAYVNQPLIAFDREKLEEMSPINHLTSDLPPIFITDGNYGSFPDQAKDYYDKLQKLGVKSELYIPDPNVSQEGHGYLADIYSEATQTYIKKKMAFLKSLQ